MTPNWPELWAREPGLRPTTVGFAKWDYYQPEDKAALCRDAAVRWLVETAAKLGIGSFVLCHSLMLAHHGKYLSFATIESKPHIHCETSDTLDGVLFQMCEEFLNALDERRETDAKETTCSNP